MSIALLSIVYPNMDHLYSIVNIWKRGGGHVSLHIRRPSDEAFHSFYLSYDIIFTI